MSSSQVSPAMGPMGGSPANSPVPSPLASPVSSPKVSRFKLNIIPKSIKPQKMSPLSPFKGWREGKTS